MNQRVLKVGFEWFQNLNIADTRSDSLNFKY